MLIKDEEASSTGIVAAVPTDLRGSYGAETARGTSPGSIAQRAYGPKI
jgi:hypothetical protein